MNTLAVIAFSVLAVGVLIVAGLLVMRDRRSYKDEMPKVPYQKDDMEEKSKRKTL